MDCTATHLPYSATGCFSKIVTDYLERSSSLRSFYEHDVTLDGVRAAIRASTSNSDASMTESATWNIWMWDLEA